MKNFKNVLTLANAVVLTKSSPKTLAPSRQMNVSSDQTNLYNYCYLQQSGNEAKIFYLMRIEVNLLGDK